MTDNVTLNAGTGGDTIRTLDRAGVETQVVALDIGGAGAESLVTSGNPLPMTASALPLPSGAATAAKQDTGNTTLASILTALGQTLAVGGSVTVSNLPATQAVSGTVSISGTVPVSGPLTDAQLRATAVPVSGTVTANAGSGTFAVSGPLTDTQLRATPVPVSLNGIAATTANPDSNTASLPVVQRPVQIWVASFADVGSSLMSPLFTQLRAGTGVTVSQSAGNLVIAAGTTANAEYLARSTTSFNGALIHRLRVTLSQRIVNNNFAFLLADNLGDDLPYTINSATSISVVKTAHGFTAANVGQFICIGGINGAAGVPGRYAIASIPDANTINFTVAGWPASGTGTLDLFGWNYYRALYNGTTATSVAIDAQRRGWASGDTTATINTTASPGHILQLAVDGRNAYWSDSLAASTTAPNVTTRGNRMENLPDPDVELFVYIWSFNGTTAPASSTTLTLGFASVEDTVNNPVYLAGVRPSGQAAPLHATLAAGANTIGAVNIASAQTLATVTTVSTVSAANLNIPGSIADVASAALTTTTTTAAFTPTFGCSYEVNIPVTAVSGTTPTLDVVIQESDDSGTNWFDVYHFPRITATGMYRSPKLPLTGNRVRYVQTVAGTTPSFTRAINRLQSSDSAQPLRKIFDRSLASTQALNSTTTSMVVLGAMRNLQLVIAAGAITTTAPAIQLQGSDDGGVTWYSLGTALTAVASSTVQQTVTNVYAELVRAIVTTAGSGATLTYVALKGF